MDHRLGERVVIAADRIGRCIQASRTELERIERLFATYGCPAEDLYAARDTLAVYERMAATVCRWCNGDGVLRVQNRDSYRDAGDVAEVECGFCDDGGEEIHS